MKKKNGFTLVELIAVVALIGVIMLLVVPNVVNTLEKGKKSTFATLVQDIYKVAEKDYAEDLAYNDEKNNYYCSSNAVGWLDSENIECKQLKFNDETADYFVELDNKGHVTKIIVANDEYCYATDEPTINVSYKDIKDGELSCTGTTCKCENELSSVSVGNITKNKYVYWSSGQIEYNVTVDSSTKPATTYDNFDSLNLPQARPFIRTTVNGDTVLGHEACFYYNNRTVCFEPDYWVPGDSDGSRTKDKLKNDVETTLGVVTSSCTYGNIVESSYLYASCFFKTAETYYEAEITIHSYKGAVCYHNNGSRCFTTQNENVDETGCH